MFRGASYQHAGGRQLQRQDLIVSGPAGGCRNQTKETGQMNESKPRRQSKRMMGTHTRRSGAFEAIGFPPGRLALDRITQEDWFG
jgi:hypothetical protein